MTESDNVRYTVTDGRAEIILDKPDVLNAMDDPMAEALNEALKAAMVDDSVYVVVLSGAGRGFCSGADITAMPDREPEKHEFRNHLWLLQNAVRLVYEGPKPTIAAINGPAVGFGCGLALGCDLRVMSEESMLREQFLDIGLVPADGGGWFLPRLIGESKAKEHILLNRDITPEDALDLGLTVDIVPQGETVSKARELADEIQEKPAMAMQRTKDVMDLNQSFEEYTEAAFQHQWECIHDAEHREAVSALNEGREPSFDRQETDS